MISLCTITAGRPQLFDWWKWNVDKQTRPPDEIVVVDDGTWPTPPGVRKVSVPREWTTGRKRNVAADTADGDYLVFFDDDDWYSAAAVECLSAQKQSGAVVGISNLYWYSPKLGTLGTESASTVHHPFIVSRSLARRVTWPDTMDGEDVAFYQACPRFVALEDELYVGIQHDKNVFNREGRRLPSANPGDLQRVLGGEFRAFHQRVERVFGAPGRTEP